MNGDTLSQYSAIVIVAIFLIKEVFAYLRNRKNGNGYSQNLAAINEKLDNHLTEVNGKIADIQRESEAMKMDIKIIKNEINDIKIALSKRG